MTTQSKQAAPEHEAASTTSGERTATAAQGELAQLIDDSPRVRAQQRLVDSVQHSPRVAARLQCKLALLGSAIGADEAQSHLAIAAQGIGSGGATLPHLAAIQQSFGMFDVAGVRAHTGAAASTAAGAIGAEAYASGNNVVFAGAPSLHTAAHEAAHVVQQRGGVQLNGAVGEAGDVYERHADAVAGRVVAGLSAEDMLAPYAGAVNADGSAPVQRVLTRLPDRCNGPNGLKDLYQDGVGGPFYRQTVGAPVGQVNLLEVTLTAGPDVRYVAVMGAVARAMDAATLNWVPAGAVAPVVVAPVAPVDWSVAQAVAANFAHQAANHYQRNEADYLGYHVHVSVYHAQQRFTQFHVKFDAGVDGHISLFYSFAQGAAFTHYGQNPVAVRRTVVKAFADRALLPAPPSTTDADANVTLALFETRANTIAAAVIAAL
jgi:hypothetical protein